MIPTDPLQVAGADRRAACWSASLFSFAVAALLAAVQTAGGLADIVSGFSFGATVDPINGNQGGMFSELYAMIGRDAFIAIGGDAWMLRGIARTFTLVPLTKAPQHHVAGRTPPRRRSPRSSSRRSRSPPRCCSRC